MAEVVDCFICFVHHRISAGERLSDVVRSPTNTKDSISNVEKAIQFMTTRNIRMHQTLAQGTFPSDITTGPDTVLCLWKLKFLATLGPVG